MENTNATVADVPEASATAAKVAELVRRGREMMIRFDTEGYEEAVPMFREALELVPTHAPAYVGLSETYSYWGFRREINGQESQSLYDMAHDYASMALRLAPELGASHRAMAIAVRRGKKNDPELRRQEVRVALDLNPNDAETWCELWRVNGYDPQDPALEKALALNPDLCGPHIDLGAVYSELGRYDLAIDELMRALRINPRNTLAFYDLAMTLDRKGARVQAVQVLEKARGLCPEEPLLQTGLEILGARGHA